MSFNEEEAGSLRTVVYSVSFCDHFINEQYGNDTEPLLTDPRTFQQVEDIEEISDEMPEVFVKSAR